ncbi:hypothetical protein ACP26L_17215 [Paenibacillus sp. S-38]
MGSYRLEHRSQPGCGSSAGCWDVDLEQLPLEQLVYGSPME